MTRRVWGSVYKRTNFIGLSDEDFEQLESKAGLTFQSHQRQRIEWVLNEYHSRQMMEWESPRANELRPLLKKIATASNEFAKALQESRMPTGKSVSGQIGRAFDWVKRQGPVVRAGWVADSGGGSVNAVLHGDIDFASWIEEEIARAELIARLTKWVLKGLPADRGGPSTGKGQFYHLVHGLAAVYVSAGGKISVTYSDAIGGYKPKGLFALVHGVQNYLPAEFRYFGTALGKEVQRLLSDYRNMSPPLFERDILWSALQDKAATRPRKKRRE
ncbi:MAG: hypothetical protein KBA31_00795 [Alphaproteobacteria bacterium]|nr:hypothetical protein [Alphaproteobacteria bacterium]